MLTQLPATLHTTTLCWLCPRSRQALGGARREGSRPRTDSQRGGGKGPSGWSTPHWHLKPLNLLYSLMWRQKTCRKWHRWRIWRFLRCFSQSFGPGWCAFVCTGHIIPAGAYCWCKGTPRSEVLLTNLLLTIRSQSLFILFPRCMMPRAERKHAGGFKPWCRSSTFTWIINHSTLCLTWCLLF